MAVPTLRDLDHVRRTLAEWLSDAVGTGVTVSDLRLPSTGTSNETSYFRASWTADGTPVERTLVLRLQPDAPRQYPTTDVGQQHRTMAALWGRAGVVVPEPLWACADPTVVGTPFFVMAEIEGRVLTAVPSWHAAGWATELSVDQRRALSENALASLAALHALDPGDGFDFMARPGSGTHLERQVAWVVDWHRWAGRGRPLGMLDEAVVFVQEQRPDDDTTCVMWGDAQPANMIFADDLSVAAMLDWEAAALGPPEVDLGWWLMFDEFLTDAQGVKHLDGVPDRAGTIARYEELTGRAVRDIEYYESLAAVTFGLIILRYVDMQVEAGVLGEETTMGTCNPVTQMLARRLGLEVPELAPEYAAVAEASTRTGQE
jgi:aminoglycoside phosphotransferase (APT) family kinase protein